MPEADADKTSSPKTVGIAIVCAVASILAASIKGYFDFVHIDARLDNLRGVDVESGLWTTYGQPQCANVGKVIASAADSDDERSCVIHVDFHSKFSKPPVIFLSTSGVGLNNSSTLYFSTRFEDINQIGFNIRVVSVSHTELTYIEGHWLAFEQ